MQRQFLSLLLRSTLFAAVSEDLAFVSDVFAAFAEFPAAVAEEAALPALEAALVSDDFAASFEAAASLADVAASDAFVVAVDADVAADCLDAAAFVSDVFAAPALVAAALFEDSAAAALLMPQRPLLRLFLRRKMLPVLTSQPVRRTCWRRVLSLQHQSHGLPPHGQMFRHRRRIFFAAAVFCATADALRATSSTISSKRRSASGRASSSVMAPRKSFSVPAQNLHTR